MLQQGFDSPTGYKLTIKIITMPCNSDYMEANSFEKNLSTVLNLLDETITGNPVDPKTYNNGYDKRVYNKGLGKEYLDKKTEELCSFLQTRSDALIKTYSLELQIWWRDHQAADKKRIQAELDAIEEEKDKQIALSKLTPHERKLLGL